VIPEEILKKIHLIHIHTNQLVNDVMAGEYESAFRGRGMEFEEVREYQPGDDIRTIDWNVTARMGRPFVKLFREERQLIIMLMVDVSSSGQFGSHQKMKNEVAAEVAAVLAYTAIRNNDKVGLILFTDRVEKYVPPKKGRGHVWRLIKEILNFQPERQRTNMVEALDFLGRVMRRRCICFLISDFLTSEFEKALRLSNKRHDMVAISLSDPRERELPRVGFIELEDAETGETVLLDTYDPDVRKHFSHMVKTDNSQLKTLFRSMDIDHVELFTHTSYIDPLLAFFRLREKRL
jgi:uncharacterized protein (DUF58 family)